MTSIWPILSMLFAFSTLAASALASAPPLPTCPSFTDRCIGQPRAVLEVAVLQTDVAKPSSDPAGQSALFHSVQRVNVLNVWHGKGGQENVAKVGEDIEVAVTFYDHCTATGERELVELAPPDAQIGREPPTAVVVACLAPLPSGSIQFELGCRAPLDAQTAASALLLPYSACIDRMCELDPTDDRCHPVFGCSSSRASPPISGLMLVVLATCCVLCGRGRWRKAALRQ